MTHKLCFAWEGYATLIRYDVFVTKKNKNIYYVSILSRAQALKSFISEAARL